MKITDTHVYFYTNQFSNWNRCKFFNKDGLGFTTTEHAFMYEKALFFNDRAIAAKIQIADHPKEAKELGRAVKGYDDELWACVRLGFMNLVNFYKYGQNPELAKLLIGTGNKILVEASPYDKIWGVGLGENDPLILDESNWAGQNLLGKSLMEVRSLLK